MNGMIEKPWTVAIISLVCGVIWIALLYAVLGSMGDKGTFLSVVLLDTGESTSFPFTIQSAMWLVFFFGLGELLKRYFVAEKEAAELQRGYLPEDENTMLRVKDLPPVFKGLNEKVEDASLFLPQMIHRIILQFQSTKAVDQAHSLLTSTLNLHEHEIDLRYTTIRYVTWLIPTIGFIGTVIGIAMALNYAGVNDMANQSALSEVTTRLGVAFNTTLVALMQSAVLVFMMQMVQAREERALNHSAQYCLDNLINRLYV